jgi:hypothetical protein
MEALLLVTTQRGSDMSLRSWANQHRRRGPEGAERHPGGVLLLKRGVPQVTNGWGDGHFKRPGRSCSTVAAQRRGKN